MTFEMNEGIGTGRGGGIAKAPTCGRDGLVQQELDEVGVCLGGLNEVLERLATRLSPVLTPTPQVNEQGEPAIKSQHESSGISSRIRVQRLILERLIVRVHQLLDSLEI